MKKLSLTVKSIYGFGLIAVLSFPLMAAAPALINYQGKLTNASGVPISGEINVTFRFYSAASGGAQIGTDQVVTVNATNGVFSTTISVPAGLFLNNPTVFLGIQVDGSSEFTERQQLVSAPYALAIQDGSVSGGEGGTITDGTIDGNDLNSSALSLSVYKTSDNRLVLGKDYKTIACSYDEGTLKFFGCDGSCDQTQPAACTAGDESFVGRLVK